MDEAIFLLYIALLGIEEVKKKKFIDIDGAADRAKKLNETYSQYAHFIKSLKEEKE